MTSRLTFERRTGYLAALGLAAGLTIGVAQAGAPPLTDNGLVLDHVTIVDTATGALQPDMTIVMSGGTITRIAHAGQILIGGTASTITARGKFVVPGYLDMHAHPFGGDDLEGSLTLMLANGITGVRQMSGSPQLLDQRWLGTLGIPAASPELLAMPGEILTRGNAPTPEAAVAEVDRQKTEGADFIKTVDLGIPAFFAALDAARKQGLFYEGHLSQGVDAVEASYRGMRSVEHLGPPRDTLLINCSTDEPALRAELARLPVHALFDGPPGAMAKIMRVAIASPALAWAMDPTALPRIQHEIDTYSDEKCRAVARTFAANGTWQVPTLIRNRTIDYGDDPAYRNNPELRYVPRETRKFWEMVAQQFSAKMSPTSKQTLRNLFELSLRITKMFDETGVPMLAGSDFGGQWHVAGSDLHAEFDLLAQAGLSPLKILQMTTLNGAKFFGREATMGSVAEGRDANLVLLDANPIETVQNFHRIDAVVRAGVYYPRTTLEAMKLKTEQRMAAGAVMPTAAEQTNAP